MSPTASISPLSPEELEKLILFLGKTAPLLKDELLMLKHNNKLSKVPTHVRLLYEDMLRIEAGAQSVYIAALQRIKRREQD